MTVSILRRRVLAGLVLATLFGGLAAATATPASAAVFRIYVDADNNTATGCPGGSFSGVEQILVTTVDTTPKVTSVQRQTCSGGTFGPLVNVGPPSPPWPAGVNNGLDGTDIVETFLPFLPVGPDVRFYVTSAPDATSAASDQMTTRQPAGAGAPIVFALPFDPAIPTLGEWGLLLFALLLGGAAVMKLRKRQRLAFVLLCLLAGGATAAFAAIVLDGQAGDWGSDQPLANDGLGDPSPDLRAFFVRYENGKLFFRIDTTLSSPQTINFTSTAPADAQVGGPTYTVTASATSGLPVTLTIDAATTSVCSIAGSTVSFLSPGTCTIDANQAGNSSFDPAPQAQQSFAVGKGDQTIDFTSTAPVGAQVGGPTYTVTATASPSGLPVAFTIDAAAASVCSIAGSTVSFLGSGTCVIDANQAGDANWNAAPQVQQSFAVGKGDQTISFTSTAPAGAKVGGPTYTVAATASPSGLPVAFTVDATATAVCSISGATVSFLAIGTCVLDANQAGDANWNAAPQVQQSFAVGKGDQTISFTSTAPAGAKVGGPTYTVTATASPSGLPVAFTVDATATAVCSIAGATVSFLSPGNCVIDANQAGDANYNAAPQVQQSFAVGKGDQTISFTSTAPAGAKVGGPTYTVTATASPSGLPVAFTIDATATAVCSIAGSTVSFLAVGTCVIDANQAGNANYNAAPQMQQSFAVGKGTQTISFTSTAPAAAKVGGPAYTVTATASPSGLPVAFTVDATATAVCSIAGSTVTFVGIGTCVIDANQAGNTNYNAAPQVQQSFAVAKGDQTISFTSTAPAAAKVGGPTYTVTATASPSGLPVAFTIDATATAVCSIAGTTVSFLSPGTCVIDANQAGNANYNAAPQVQQSFAVAKGTQTISFTSTAPVAAKVGGPTYTVTATASPSGLPVTFTIDATATAVCSIAGSTVSFLGVGTCVIDANQAGNANYNAAPQVQQSFAVAKGDQTISFTSTAPAAAAVGGPTYTVTATASPSGLPVTFTIDASASAVCSIAGSTVSFTGPGTCVIDANQPGNASYNAAPQAQQSFAVAKGTQTISFTSTAPVAAKVGGPTYTVTATATPSGLPVTFTIDATATSVCSIAGSTVSFVGIGTCVIDANQPGNASYNAATQVQQSFAVAKGTQTISFTSTAPAAATVNGPTYTVTATATSGLPVTFTIDATATSVCSITGSTVSFLAAGTCVIDANQAGNTNFNAAPQVQQSFAVAKGSQTISFTSTAPVGAKVGGPTYTVTATATSGLPVTFTIDASATAVCSIAGSTVSLIGPGICVIDANQAGNANFNAAPQAQQSFAVAKGDQTIGFTSTAPAGAAVGGPTYTVTATATPSGLPVTFTIDASATSVCSIAGSTVSFLAAGTCVIDANQPGNASYNAAPQAQQSFAVAKGNQTISFTSTAPVAAAVGGPSYTVTATATSGLPVTFTIDATATTVCSIAGSTVSFLAAGTCVIDANQPGNANFNAAPQVQQSFAVAKGNQTVSFTSTAPLNAKVGGPTYTVTATASSGLPVTLTIDASATAVCSIAGSTVSFIGAGTCVIDANQAGNANFNAAPQVQQSFVVAKNDQTITFTSTPPLNAAPGGPTYTVTATASSGLAVVFTIDASATSVCSISGSTVSFLGGGTCVIDANQPGNANFNPAPQVQQSFHVNFPPQLSGAAKETFDTIGNTQFEFKGAQTQPPSIFVTGNLVANFTDPDGPSPLSAVAIVGGTTTNGGKVDLATNGEFTFTPKAGDTQNSDSFSYQITDGLSTVTRTVTLRRFERVWYVKNTAPAGGLGRSNDPFNTLAAAQTASVANDYVFVYFGDGTTTGQANGIILKNGQRLIGEFEGLTVLANNPPAAPLSFNGTATPTNVTVSAAPSATACSGNPCRPLLDNPAVNGNAVSATDAIPTAILGLSLAGNTNAVDLTTTGAFAGSGALNISDNVVRSTGIEGFDINAAGTGALALAISNNSITAGVRGIDVLRTAGTVTITGFANNAISGDTGGSGIEITGVIFDATPGNPINPVSGGTTVIGQSGNGTSTNGMLLTNVTGDLQFTDLDIVNDAGAGLAITSTGALNAAAGTGFHLSVASGVGSIDSNGGPAVSVNNASLNLPLLAFLRSSNSTTTGVSLVNAFGGVGGTTLSATGGRIDDPASGGSGTAFNVDGGNGSVSYPGPITSTSGNIVAVANRTGDTVSFSSSLTASTGSAGIALTNNTGATVSFTGPISLTTTTNDGFTATGGGTVTATDTTSTITTTTGRAINVANTTIGAGGLKFKSVSAGTAASGPANGIVLNNTGAGGSLTVIGGSGAGSGGTIQNTTSHAVSLTSTLSPSFSNVTIQNTAGSGVKGTTVTNFSFVNGSIDNSGTGGGADESNIAFNAAVVGTENNVSGTVTITGNSLTNSAWHGIDVQNFNGTASNVTISGNTITSSTSVAASKGTGIRLQALGSATTAANVTTATLTNNVISNFPSGAGILAQGGNSNAAGPAGTFGTPGSGNVIAITSNQIKGQSAANRMGTSAIIATINGKGQANFNITGNGTVANPLANTIGTVILCGANGNTTSTYTVNNNVIVANNNAASNGIGGGTGITFGTTDAPNMTWTITGNQISATDGNGILAVARGATGSLKAKIQNNNVAAPLTGVRNGIRVDAGNAASVNDSVCLNISGNTTAGSGGTQGIGLRKQGTASATNAFGINGMAATASPGVEAFVDGLNPAGSGTLLISAASGFSNCSLP